MEGTLDSGYVLEAHERARSQPGNGASGAPGRNRAMEKRTMGWVSGCAGAASVLLAVGCGSADLNEEEPTGVVESALIFGASFTSHSSVADLTGVPLGTADTQSCFLSGLVGDFVAGASPTGAGSVYRESVARAAYVPATGSYSLVAYAGRSGSEGTLSVKAQATCLKFAPGTTVRSFTARWQAGELPKYVAPFRTGTQCFISGIWGVTGAGYSSGGPPVWQHDAHGGVVVAPVADATHPVPGFYAEGNLVPSVDGLAKVEARCIELPPGAVVTAGTLVAPQGGTVTKTITSGQGAKACGLTRITGPFHPYSTTDGISMSMVDLFGNYSITVKNGKRADWLCVR